MAKDEAHHRRAPPSPLRREDEEITSNRAMNGSTCVFTGSVYLDMALQHRRDRYLLVAAVGKGSHPNGEAVEHMHSLATAKRLTIS